MVNSTFTLKTPGDVRGSRSITYKHRGMWEAPEALPKKPDVEAEQYLSITLLTTANYYLLLTTITLSCVWCMMENNNTHKDQLLFVGHHYSTQLPPKSTLQRSFNIDIYRVGKKSNKLRQKQYFENSQKYLGAREGFS